VSIRRNRNAAALALKATELGVAAPLVIAHRLTRMALAGHPPSIRDQREFSLMSAEKVAAFYESWNAMFTQSIRIQQDIAASIWRSFWSHGLNAHFTAKPPKFDLPHATLRIVSKGLGPVHRRAVANAKRLSRTGFR
jgi:hypothetical protein